LGLKKIGKGKTQGDSVNLVKNSVATR